MLAYAPMSRLLASLACACAGLASGQDKPGAFSVALDAAGMHEECAHLAAGEKRNYSWKSDGPVDFNVHYHQGREVFYPVKRTAMRGDGGTFTAKIAQDYCWMWTARDKAVKLEGRIEK